MIDQQQFQSSSSSLAFLNSSDQPSMTTTPTFGAPRRMEENNNNNNHNGRMAANDGSPLLLLHSPSSGCSSVLSSSSFSSGGFLHSVPSPEVDILSCTPAPFAGFRAVNRPPTDLDGSASSTDDGDLAQDKKYFCQRCLNHKEQHPRKGHKPFCRYRECNCGQCQMVEKRRVLNNALSTRKPGEGKLKIQHGPKPRNPKCARCTAHGADSQLKGHKKALCPYWKCRCSKCTLVMERRQLMADQIKLRRRQKKEREGKPQQHKPMDGQERGVDMDMPNKANDKAIKTSPIQSPSPQMKMTMHSNIRNGTKRRQPRKNKVGTAATTMAASSLATASFSSTPICPNHYLQMPVQQPEPSGPFPAFQSFSVPTSPSSAPALPFGHAQPPAFPMPLHPSAAAVLASMPTSVLAQLPPLASNQHQNYCNFLTAAMALAAAGGRMMLPPPPPQAPASFMGLLPSAPSSMPTSPTMEKAEIHMLMEKALNLQSSMAAAQMSMSNENMLASAQQQPQKPFSSIETLLSLSTLFLNAQQQQQQQ